MYKAGLDQTDNARSSDSVRPRLCKNGGAGYAGIDARALVRHGTILFRVRGTGW